MLCPVLNNPQQRCWQAKIKTWNGAKKGKAKESGPFKSGDIVKQLRIEPEDTYYKNVLLFRDWFVSYSCHVCIKGRYD